MLCNAKQEFIDTILGEYEFGEILDIESFFHIRFQIVVISIRFGCVFLTRFLSTSSSSHCCKKKISLLSI